METVIVVAVVLVALAAAARMVFRALTGKHGCSRAGSCEECGKQK
jgi:hypothetical protein